MYPPFKWPDRGDKAFVRGVYGKSIDTTILSDYFPMHASAFKAAADALIKDWERLDDRHDSAFLPIAFLYRHCIELKLKELIDLGVQLRLFEAAEVKKMLGEHALQPLWQRVKKMLQQRWQHDEFDDAYEAVESIIKEFHNLDPTGQALRYATNKNGKPHRYAMLPVLIDPIKLRDAMLGVYTLLDRNGEVFLDDLIARAPEC